MARECGFCGGVRGERNNIPNAIPAQACPFCLIDRTGSAGGVRFLPPGEAIEERAEPGAVEAGKDGGE